MVKQFKTSDYRITTNEQLFIKLFNFFCVAQGRYPSSILFSKGNFFLYF